MRALRARVRRPSRSAADDFETALCWNIAVPARVRANLAAREIDDDDVLRALDVPLLVTHGRADTVVLPAMAEHILATCPTAEASWYDGVGHAAAPRGARALQPRARRADPARQGRVAFGPWRSGPRTQMTLSIPPSRL